MKVEYVDHMGDDLTVVNSARVSFDKESEYDQYLKLKDGDVKLIHYLAKHGHWTPFSHPMVTVRVTVPIFVARQLFKHKVGMTENEVSRRYVDDDPEFYFPETWRAKPTDGAKQGSSQEPLDQRIIDYYDDEYSVLISYVECLYNEMIDDGVAPEQARMILPQSMYTSWYWTGSLAAFARIYKQRSDSHAQQETQEVAKMLDRIIRPLFPVSWEALTSVTN